MKILCRLLTAWLGVFSVVVAADEFETEVYRQIGGISLNMRVYKPANWKAADSRPAIVFFFGGGWKKGGAKQFHQHSLHLTKQGMVALAADYRISSLHDSKPADSVADALAAIRWARANAGKLGIDPQRLAAGGGSAGGHLAAATATLGKGDEAPDALVLFNPALNLLAKDKYREDWGATKKEFIALSPHHHLKGSLPPTVVFHGTKDTAVPFSSITAFAAKAKKLGVKNLRVHPYEGGSHGFFNYGRDGNRDYLDTVGKMDGFLTRLGWLDWTVKTRKVVKTKGKELTVESDVTWNLSETAIIIVDMWNDHHCVSAARRVVEMAPHMNRVVKAARDRGVLIVHAPSGCSDYYRDQPVRRNIAAAPLTKTDIRFRWNYFNPKHEGPLADHLEKAGCSCDTPEVCGPDKRVWTHQIKTIEMARISMP